MNEPSNAVPIEGFGERCRGLIESHPFTAEERAIIEAFVRFTEADSKIQSPCEVCGSHIQRYLDRCLPAGTWPRTMHRIRVRLFSFAAIAWRGTLAVPSGTPTSRSLVESVRRLLEENNLPPADRGRVEEFARFAEKEERVGRIEDLGPRPFERFVIARMRAGDSGEAVRATHRALEAFASAAGLRRFYEIAWRHVAKLVRLSRSRGIWIAEAHTPEGEERIADAGFRRHRATVCASSCAACVAGIPEGAWWTSDPTVASRVPYQTDRRTHFELLETVRESNRRSFELSQATSSPIDVPAPAGRRYLGFQKVAIAYALGRRATLLADEMGLGKTIEALGVVNADPAIRKVLVVCPASLSLHWRREADAWLVRPFRTHVVEAARAVPSDADFVVVSYGRSSGPLQEFLLAARWDLLIADEAHYAKNPGARRTKALLGDETRPGLIARAERLLFLTGTPIMNRLEELYTLVSALDPATWGFRSEFERRYGRPEGRKELQQRLRETVMVRRMKADVLKELPEKRRTILPLPGEVAAGAVAEEREVLMAQARAIGEIAQDLAGLVSGGDAGSYRAAVERLKEARLRAWAEISRARHRVAVAKIPAVILHLEAVLEAGIEKVVVWAHHRDVIAAIAERFGREAVAVSGEAPLSERPALVDRFQKDSSCRLFIGSLQAAGVGITLTAAAHVVFAELDWSPGTLTQAEDRCHRIGQRASLFVEHLVVDGSVDARMAKIVVAKQDLIRDALDSLAVKEVEDVLDLALGGVGEAA